jgi:hypothetical protein
MKVNTTNTIFNANHIQDGNKFNPKIGNHPPKNIIEIKVDIRRIFAYSAKKNSTNPTAEYSTLYPDTNSDSASGKSKGILFVSARAEIKNNINEGKNAIKKLIVC